MITTHEFRVDDKLREILPDTFESFPCFCKYNTLNSNPGKWIRWHWHPSFEINYFLKGATRFRTPETDVLLQKGDAVFINSNTLHQMEPSAPGAEAEYYTIFFDAELLSGGYGTLLHEQYLMPVLSCQGLQSFSFNADSPGGIRMLNILIDIVDLFREEPRGYELDVRTKLGQLWLMLLDETQDLRTRFGHTKMLDHVRVKEMIGFVEEHYGEKITLQEIAQSAGLGERECGRCFSRSIGMPPIEYLNRYRIRQAARLIVQTSDPIGQIAEQCGFSSDSYFGKMFREQMGCSPREYRKRKELTLPE